MDNTIPHITTTEAQHTPLPWTYMHVRRGMYSSHQVINEKDVVCATTGPHCKANAQFIVTACNICNLSIVELEGIAEQGGLKAVLNRLTTERAALLAACEAALDAILTSHVSDGSKTKYYTGHVAPETVDHLRTALASARKGGER